MECGGMRNPGFVLFFFFFFKQKTAYEIGMRDWSSDVCFPILDGVEMVFQNTPDTESPSEMNTYFPQFKALWTAENVIGTMHNDTGRALGW